MARRVVVYNDFSKGDYGHMESWNAPKGSWTGVNMYPTLAGELAVRPGLQEESMTIGSGDNIAHAGINYSGELLTIDFSGVVRNQSTPAAAPIAGGTVTDGCLTPSGDNFFFTAQGAGDSYLITMATTPTITTLTGSPGGRCIVEYGVRLVVGTLNDTTNRNVLQFSAASDYNTWPAANTIRVGSDSSAIKALYVQDDHLLIAKPEGWFVITGPIETGTLRRLNSLPTPNRARQGFITGLDKLGYISADSFSPFIMTTAYGQEHKLLSMDVESYANGMLKGDDMWWLVYQDILNSNTLDMWIWDNDKWVHWQVEMDEIGYPGYAQVSWVLGLNRETSFAQPPQQYEGRKIYMLVEDADQTEAVQVFRWNIGRTGMPLPADFYVSPGDNSLTSKVVGNFSMPEWYSDEGSEIMVRGVTVEFRAWDQDTGETNHFDVAVDAIRVYDNNAPITSATLEYDEDEALASDGRAGTLKRRTFSFGDQGHGNGFQVHLSNIRGCSIRRIEVIIESQSVRGV